MANDNIFKTLYTATSTEKKIVEAENKNTDSANQVRVEVAKRYIRLADEATTPEEVERHLNGASQEADKISIDNDKAREANEKHSKRITHTLVGAFAVTAGVALASQIPQIKEFAEKQLPKLLPGSKKS